MGNLKTQREIKEKKESPQEQIHVCVTNNCSPVIILSDEIKPFKSEQPIVYSISK